jgi:AcrR family transcriptional regulator
VGSRSLVHEHGAGELTLARIATRARIGRLTLYKIFENKADCLEFACEEARRHLVGPIEAAGGAPRPWVERMDSAVEGLLASIHRFTLTDSASPLRTAGIAKITG